MDDGNILERQPVKAWKVVFLNIQKSGRDEIMFFGLFTISKIFS